MAKCYRLHTPDSEAGTKTCWVGCEGWHTLLVKEWLISIDRDRLWGLQACSLYYTDIRHNTFYSTPTSSSSTVFGFLQTQRQAWLQFRSQFHPYRPRSAGKHGVSTRTFLIAETRAYHVSQILRESHTSEPQGFRRANRPQLGAIVGSQSLTLLQQITRR